MANRIYNRGTFSSNPHAQPKPQRPRPVSRNTSSRTDNAFCNGKPADVPGRSDGSGIPGRFAHFLVDTQSRF